MANLLQKLIFRSGIIADADIRTCIKPLHTSFEKYLVHILVKFEQNRMVQTIQSFMLFDKKMFNNF